MRQISWILSFRVEEAQCDIQSVLPTAHPVLRQGIWPAGACAQSSLVPVQFDDGFGSGSQLMYVASRMKVVSIEVRDPAFHGVHRRDQQAGFLFSAQREPACIGFVPIFLGDHVAVILLVDCASVTADLGPGFSIPITFMWTPAVPLHSFEPVTESE